MKVIGITGGAGTGKSEVMKILAEDFGTYVILSDDVARDLTLKGNSCYDAICGEFGTHILRMDEEIDRKKLAEIVFNDKAALAKLNSLTHPLVRSEILSQIQSARTAGAYEMTAVEAALLIEERYDQICDELWYIHTNEAIRRMRMKESRGYSDEKIDAVIKNQLDEQIFRNKCQFVIENNSSLEAVRNQLRQRLSMRRNG